MGAIQLHGVTHATHDQTEAMTLGQRVAVLKDGVREQVGTPQALYHQPANLFVAAFSHRLALGEGVEPPGLDRVVVGIRPTAVAS